MKGCICLADRQQLNHWHGCSLFVKEYEQALEDEILIITRCKSGTKMQNVPGASF